MVRDIGLKRMLGSQLSFDICLLLDHRGVSRSLHYALTMTYSVVSQAQSTKRTLMVSCFP